MKPLRIVLGTALAAALLACVSPSDEAAADLLPVSEASAAPRGTGGYDLTAPALRVDLAEALREVSGVTVLPDGRLAAVQDEDGVVYTLDATSGAVVAERRFTGPGDFEGVEWTPGALWVLRADGTLFELPHDGGAAVEHGTPLTEDCDAEGFGYDALNERLLVACKDDPADGRKDVRAVYAFGLANRQLAATPTFLLDRAEVDGDDNFKPAGLAVHPETGRVYIVSSDRTAIAVLDPAGRLLAVTPLPAAENAQPEGLAFAPDGAFYLTNEGPDGPATLARFDPLDGRSL